MDLSSKERSGGRGGDSTVFLRRGGFLRGRRGAGVRLVEGRFIGIKKPPGGELPKHQKMKMEAGTERKNVDQSVLTVRAPDTPFSIYADTYLDMGVELMFHRAQTLFLPLFSPSCRSVGR